MTNQTDTELDELMAQITQKTTEVKPVKYYVGDLCYVMHNEWNEVCGVADLDNDEWEYELEDGRKFIFFSTAFGDGEYEDLDGNLYSVDSGSIGAIKVDDITDLNGLQNAIENGLGHIHEFPVEIEGYDCYYQDGEINIYRVSIPTGSFNDAEMAYDENNEEDA